MFLVTHGSEALTMITENRPAAAGDWQHTETSMPHRVMATDSKIVATGR
ncbi:MAG: hypothetical protein ACLRP3_12570 [Escherichia sp.]